MPVSLLVIKYFYHVDTIDWKTTIL